jgi:hypothetical protein
MNDTEDPIIVKLVSWGKGITGIRAMILTSTRTSPDASLDIFSDYDVIVAVTDIRPYL